MTKLARFTQADIRRAVKGAMLGGWNNARVRICRDGAIEIVPLTAQDNEPDEIKLK